MIWILFGIICMGVGYLAQTKFNRNFWIWSFLAFLFSPLFMVILLFILEFFNTSAIKFNRQIMDLYKLYKNNLISKEEFEYKKSQLIQNIKTNQKEKFLQDIYPLIQNGILTESEINQIKQKLMI